MWATLPQWASGQWDSGWHIGRSACSNCLGWRHGQCHQPSWRIYQHDPWSEDRSWEGENLSPEGTRGSWTNVIDASLRAALDGSFIECDKVIEQVQNGEISVGGGHPIDGGKQMQAHDIEQASTGHWKGIAIGDVGVPPIAEVCFVGSVVLCHCLSDCHLVFIFLSAISAPWQAPSLEKQKMQALIWFTLGAFPVQLLHVLVTEHWVSFYEVLGFAFEVQFNELDQESDHSMFWFMAAWWADDYWNLTLDFFTYHGWPYWRVCVMCYGFLCGLWLDVFEFM